MAPTVAVAPSSEWLRRAGRLLALLWCLTLGTRSVAAEYRPLPPAAPSGLSNDWLIYAPETNKLVLYLPGYHSPARAYYQWVTIRPDQPFRITFGARQHLALFLDNRLVFQAPRTANYTLNLAELLPPDSRIATHLLCVWHPEQSPNYASFSNAEPESAKVGASASVGRWQPKLRLAGHEGENTFLCFLLLIGLLYGAVRTIYRPGFARIYELWSNNAAEQNFLSRPTITWLNLLLVLIFSLSLGLLIVAIHTNAQSLVLLRQLFAVPESDLVLRVMTYAILVAAFVLVKVVYLSLMGYIFNVSSLVLVQYREFVRSLLFMGLFLPIVILLYLVLNQTWPQGVLWVSNGVVSLMLVATVFRVARTLHRRASLLNLHLFSYLCATEIIPLTVLLKLLIITS